MAKCCNPACCPPLSDYLYYEPNEKNGWPEWLVEIFAVGDYLDGAHNGICCPCQWDIDGNEYTVALVGNIALPVIKLVPPGKFYDYEAKYNSNDTKYICPSELSDNVEEELKKISLKCFKVLNCKGWGRVDIILDSKNKPWIIELNTVPGMTKNSLVPMAAKQVNISFDELVLKILDTSFK